MITPRLMNPNFEPSATLEGIAYFFLLLFVLLAWVIYSETKKDQKDGKK
jgi:ATP/ADP translocase